MQRFLRRHCRFETRELDETRAQLAVLWEKHQAQVRGGEYFLRWSQAELARTTLVFIEQRGQVDLRCEGPGGNMFRVAMNETGNLRLRLNGVKVAQTPERAAIHAPGQHLEFSADPINCLMVWFKGDVVERALHRRFNRLPAYETWATGFSLEDGTGAAFHSLCRWTAKELDRPDSVLLASRQAAASLDRALLALFLDCLAERYPLDARWQKSLCEADVRRIEDWIEANLGEPIGVEELAAVVAADCRAVQAAFRRWRGCSPIQALIRRRLAAARRSLEAPDGMTSVTSVAMDCGFFHFGRFSLRYRTTFGEMPSETLARGRRRQSLYGTAA